MYGFPTFVSICKVCGLVQLNPRWSETSYREFYQNKFDEFYREASFNSKKIKTILYRMKKYGFYMASPKNILDIGAGHGDALVYLRDHLYTESRCFAIEPSFECSNHLQTNQIELISKSIEDDWEDNYENFFDFIILRHVLEHIFDPELVLKKIAKVLKDDGVLYLSVPNALKPTYPIRNNHFRNVHIYYFNRLSLENLFCLSGLKSEKMVEGDSFLSSELFCFVRTSKTSGYISENEEFSSAQKKIYFKRLRLEKYRVFVFLKRLEKAMNSFVSNVRFFFSKID
jgi:2-polyprenyl-3-methyl-5-hydroxy-6-metoxy-1,4-benzoquinol methylase